MTNSCYPRRVILTLAFLKIPWCSIPRLPETWFHYNMKSNHLSQNRTGKHYIISTRERSSHRVRCQIFIQKSWKLSSVSCGFKLSNEQTEGLSSAGGEYRIFWTIPGSWHCHSNTRSRKSAIQDRSCKCDRSTVAMMPNNMYWNGGSCISV
jgi:hypothetical protein